LDGAKARRHTPQRTWYSVNNQRTETRAWTSRSPRIELPKRADHGVADFNEDASINIRGAKVPFMLDQTHRRFDPRGSSSLAA
jgi:hypothetical protein